MSSDSGIWTGHAYLYSPQDNGTGFGIIKEAATQFVAGRPYVFSTTEPANGHTINWNFGDGTTAQCKTGETVEHTFSTDGDFKVSARCHQMTIVATTVIGSDGDLIPLSAFSEAFSSAFS